jgi:hypothetical protein
MFIHIYRNVTINALSSDEHNFYVSITENNYSDFMPYIFPLSSSPEKVILKVLYSKTLQKNNTFTTFALHQFVFG